MSQTAKARLWVMAALLAIVVLLALLFGLGVMRQFAPSNYITYVILGGFAAALTFGVLNSAGELRGQAYGMHIELTGSVVALAVVTGGGIWFDLRAPTFEQEIEFQGGEEPIDLKGNLKIQAAGKTYPGTTAGGDSAAVKNLPSDIKGQKAKLKLDAEGFALAKANEQYTLGEGIWSVEVARRKGPTKYTGTLRIDGAPLKDVSLSIPGTSCSGVSKDNGYFEIPCDMAPPQTLSVSILGRRLCPPEWRLEKLAGTDVRLGTCPEDAGTGGGGNGGDGGPKPKPGPCGPEVRGSVVALFQSKPAGTNTTIDYSVSTAGQVTVTSVKPATPGVASPTQRLTVTVPEAGCTGQLEVTL